MARREFLQLANTYKPDKYKIGGYYVSEKLDGTRCFWDGGLSRGIAACLVPWASVIDPKTGKRKDKIKPVATGLWSRYGNPIMAPDWFLDQLPPIFLDGELWAGRGKFQLCRSICAGDTPDPRFDQIQYMVYSSPKPEFVWQDGEIKNTNMVCTLAYSHCVRFLEDWTPEAAGRMALLYGVPTFQDELEFLAKQLVPTENVRVHQQNLLPRDEEVARACLDDFMDKVLDQGGEGVVIRDPGAKWTPKRHKQILKWKPFEDAEARIVGFTSGRKTDKGSKHLGKIGALIVDYEGKRLELAGLTDKEREFLNPDWSRTAAEHPGEDMPSFFQGKHFKNGQTVTFKYRELTDGGIPKDARYWRRREVE